MSKYNAGDTINYEGVLDQDAADFLNRGGAFSGFQSGQVIRHSPALDALEPCPFCGGEASLIPPATGSALTQPKADVDLEDLKRKYGKKDLQDEKDQITGWNNCIDHLAAQGYIDVPEGWRDIDSAPDDGTEILIAAWIVPSDYSQQNGSKPFWDIAIGNCYSRTLRGNKWTSVLGGNPSFWMPLPAAPKKEGE